LIGIGRDDPIAIRLNHVCAISSEVGVQPQIEPLKHPFHRGRSRQELKIVILSGFGRANVKSVFNIFEIQGGVDCSNHRVDGRTFT
jgi:hypothetical protein